MPPTSKPDATWFGLGLSAEAQARYQETLRGFAELEAQAGITLIPSHDDGDEGTGQSRPPQLEREGSS